MYIYISSSKIQFTKKKIISSKARSTRYLYINYNQTFLGVKIPVPYLLKLKALRNFHQEARDVMRLLLRRILLSANFSLCITYKT